MLTWPPLPPHPDDLRRAGVAVIGAGFVGRGLVHRLVRLDDLGPPLLANRHVGHARAAFEAAGVNSASVEVTDDPERLGTALADRRPVITADARVLPEVAGLDVVVEATGAMAFGVEVMLGALRAGNHVVSMNAEVDALVGHLLDREARQHGAVYSIADGDQPGVLLRVIDEARALGLDPAFALNCKRNLDVRQSPEDSRPYAERDGTSVAMTTAFGDGTKLHIENVVTANLSGLRPAPFGTAGIATELADVAADVAAGDLPHGTVHFTLAGDFGGGVLVLATTDDPAFDAPYLRYGKLGDGPLYPLFRPYHLIHMEVPTTIRQVLAGSPLGVRTPEPVASCIAVAKRDLTAGEPLDGIGGGTAYGVAISRDDPDAAGALPIGLSDHARVVRDVPADAPITLDDVELDHDAPLVELHGSTP
jgi:predicted homoserine dehydrogenase-like protein